MQLNDTKVMRTRRGRREDTAQVAALSGVLGIGLVLAFTSLELPLICPLRTLTGVPCPFCGMTTGTVATLRGNLTPAVQANPFGPLVPVGASWGILDRIRRIVKNRPRRVWSQLARRLALAGAATALLTSWVFQLYRFHVL